MGKHFVTVAIMSTARLGKVAFQARMPVNAASEKAALMVGRGVCELLALHGSLGAKVTAVGADDATPCDYDITLEEAIVWAVS